MSNRYTRKGTNRAELYLSRKRKKNRGENLGIWSKKQKDLAAQREVALTLENLLTNVAPGETSQLSLETLISSEITKPNSFLVKKNDVGNSCVTESVSSNDLDLNTRNITLNDEKVLQTHKSVETQVDFETTKSSKKNKAISCCLLGPKSSKKVNVKSLPTKAVINGRRIIDFRYFFKELKRVNDHSKLDCNLNDIIITSEVKVGLRTSYRLKCTICNFEKVIRTENHYKKKNLNFEFVSAMLRLNCSFEAINLLLATLSLPSLSYSQFIKECDKISSFKQNEEISENLEESEKEDSSIISVEKNVTSISDKPNIFEQQNLGDLLLEEQFEIKEENGTDNENEPETITSDMTSVDKLIVDQEQEAFNIEIKQEIISDLDDDDEDITDPELNEMETLKEHRHFENDIQSKAVSPQQNVTICKNKDIVNQERINLCKSIMNRNIHSDKLVNSEINNLEITNKEITFKNQPAKKAKIAHHVRKSVNQQHSKLGEFNLSDVDIGKNRKTYCGVKSKSVTACQQVPFDINEKIRKSIFATTLGMADPQKNMTTAPSKERKFFKHKRSESSAPQMACNIASGTNQSVQKACIPQASTSVQQNIGQSGTGPRPVTATYSSWFNNYRPSSNPLIIYTGVSGVPFVPGAQPAVQQFVTLPTVPNSGGAAATMPLAPTLLPPSVNPVNRPPLNAADGPRWIGRENMNNNNPFFTLPGGTPKGTSDPSSSKSDQPDHCSKRPRFRCDDCDVTFVKYESWDTHMKFYCIKRLKLPPSSTVTSNMMMNNPLQSTHTNHEKQMMISSKPEIQELSAAVAVKRSLLENSMMAALEAHHIINAHKLIQVATRKTFQELNSVLEREKTLLRNNFKTSTERRRFSETRARALIKAETAFKEEQYSAAAVEQALYKQKTTIEATLAATEQEQTALVTIFNSLKVTNQNRTSSMLHSDYIDLSRNGNFSQEKLMDTSPEETIQQQVSDLSLGLYTVPKTVAKSDICMEQTNEIGTISPANILHNPSSLDIYSERLYAVNTEGSTSNTPNVSSEVLNLKK